MDDTLFWHLKIDDRLIQIMVWINQVLLIPKKASILTMTALTAAICLFSCDITQNGRVDIRWQALTKLGKTENSIATGWQCGRILLYIPFLYNKKKILYYRSLCLAKLTGFSWWLRCHCCQHSNIYGYVFSKFVILIWIVVCSQPISGLCKIICQSFSLNLKVHVVLYHPIKSLIFQYLSLCAGFDSL